MALPKLRYNLGIDIRSRHWFDISGVRSFSQARKALLSELAHERGADPSGVIVELDTRENEYEGTKIKATIAIIGITCEDCEEDLGDDAVAAREHRCVSRENADATS